MRAAVESFREALTEYLALHTMNTGFGAVGLGSVPAIFPRQEADPKRVAELAAKTARAAGHAGDAVALTNSLVAVQGVGLVDPIANWGAMARPKPVVEPADVLGACERAIGVLEGMVLKAEAEQPSVTGIDALHPAVREAARQLWFDGHHRQAVAAAANALVAAVKVRTGRNDVPETSLWQQTFSTDAPQPGKPRLRWPGNPTDLNVTTMQTGLLQYAAGAQMTIRNRATHSGDEPDPQVAMEELAALSLLARRVDACDLDEAPAPAGP